MKSLSIASHFEPSSTEASQVVSLVRSAWFILLGFQLGTSLVQRSSWCLAIILACSQNRRHCQKIHDVIPLTVNTSSNWRVALTI